MNELERIQGTDSVADGLMKSDRNFTRIKNELENIDMSEQIGTHDTNDKSHADIRQEIENLTSQTNQIASQVVTHKEEISSKLEEVPFICTPTTGHSITVSKCFLKDKMININIKVDKTDGASFATTHTNLASIPYSLPISIVGIGAIGLTAAGEMREIQMSAIFQYNKTIAIRTSSTDVKSVYVQGSFKID